MSDHRVRRSARPSTVRQRAQESKNGAGGGGGRGGRRLLPSEEEKQVREEAERLELLEVTAKQVFRTGGASGRGLNLEKLRRFLQERKCALCSCFLNTDQNHSEMHILAHLLRCGCPPHVHTAIPEHHKETSPGVVRIEGFKAAKRSAGTVALRKSWGALQGNDIEKQHVCGHCVFIV